MSDSPVPSHPAVIGDLSGRPILLAPDGPRVIDFGIARASDASTLTALAQRPGTPAFMAPEQVLGEAAGPAADVFALGVVLAYAATGRSPYGEGTSDVMLFRVVHHSPDLTGIHDDLRELIVRCLDRDPRRRPAAAAVVEWSRGHGAPVRPGTWLPTPVATRIGAMETALDGRTTRPRRFVQPRMAAIAAAALAIAVGSVLLQLAFAGTAGNGAAAPGASPSASTSTAGTASPTPSSKTTATARRRVPDVRGLTADAAGQRVRNAGLQPTTVSQPSGTVAAGEVIDSDPKANTLVDGGSTVRLLVSSGPDPTSAAPSGFVTEVSGRVVDTAGAPVPDAWVVVTDSASQSLTTRTDASGRFRFVGRPGTLRAGRLVLRAEADTHQPETVTTSGKAGQAVVGVTITLTPVIG